MINKILDEIEKEFETIEDKSLNDSEWDTLLLLMFLYRMRPESTINIYVGGK